MTMLIISEIFCSKKYTMILAIVNGPMVMGRRCQEALEAHEDYFSDGRLKRILILNKVFNYYGVINATHIQMDLLYNESLIDWYDHENNYSMLFQGIINSNMWFLDICTG
eukprot:Gb_32519 [translate_table: standard]